MDRVTQVIESVIVGVFISLMGGVDLLLKVFLIIILLDMLTGILKSMHQGKYNSSKFREGLYRKSAYFIAIILVVQLDKLTGNTGTFRSILMTFMVGNEMISIIENLGQMGVPFPKKIISAIEVLKNKDEDIKTE